jgi:hypothetical protein
MPNQNKKEQRGDKSLEELLIRTQRIQNILNDKETPMRRKKLLDESKIIRRNRFEKDEGIDQTIKL